MKFLIYLLVIFVAAIAGYIFQPGIYKFGEGLRPQKVVIVLTQDEKQRQKMREAAAPKHDIAETRKLMDKLKESMADPNKPTNVVASTPTGITEDEIDKKYPLPKLRKIEEITKDWTSVPSRAFPRKVKSKLPIDFQVAAGKTTLPPNSDLTAFAFEGGMMTVGRSESDTIRTTVTLASTDFQETMTRLYNAYVEKRTSDVMKARENARFRRDNPAPPPPPEDQQAKLAGPRPATDQDGKVEIMLKSILAKEVTEFKGSNIQSWGPIEFESEGGKGFWTCTIVVRMSTMFGEVDTDITAYMANGKLIKWIFDGSKEPVN